MMQDRQIRIINKVITETEPIKISELALSEGVSIQTIYNDLRVIEGVRITSDRGGVKVVYAKDKDSNFDRKVNTHRDIREKACEYVINNILTGNQKEVLFIDGGSTGYIFFDMLKSKDISDLSIITNNPLILGSLSTDENFFYRNSVIVTGGRVDPSRLALYSMSQRSDFFAKKRTNPLIGICILGVRAIAANGDIYVENIINKDEITRKKNLIANSRKLIMIVTPDKLGVTGLYKIALLSKEFEAKNRGINIIIANNGPLPSEASATVKGLIDLLGESSVIILDKN